MVPDILRHSAQVGRALEHKFFVSEEVTLTADVHTNIRDESLVG
jgi:hypothetical protein